MILAEVSVPAPGLMLNSNDRPHRMAEAKLKKLWRMAGKMAAREQAVPVLPKPVRIEAHVWKPRANHYDPGNFYPTAKPILDGIVDAGWLPDDDFMHVIGPDMRHGGIGPSRIVFKFVTD